MKRGITLAEVVVSVPLVGLVLVGAMRTTGGVLQTWNMSHDVQSSQALAQHLMAEILQQPYEDPEDAPVFGIETGEDTHDRKKWDDVDDYDGWSQSPPVDKEDKDLDGYKDDSWTRAASVAYVQLNDPTQSTGSDQGLKRITVTVTDPSGHVTELVAYRSKGGVLEELPAVDATIPAYAAHELEVHGQTLHGGVHLPNHAEDP